MSLESMPPPLKERAGPKDIRQFYNALQTRLSSDAKSMGVEKGEGQYGFSGVYAFTETKSQKFLERMIHSNREKIMSVTMSDPLPKESLELKARLVTEAFEKLDEANKVDSVMSMAADSEVEKEKKGRHLLVAISDGDRRVNIWQHLAEAEDEQMTMEFNDDGSDVDIHTLQQVKDQFASAKPVEDGIMALPTTPEQDAYLQVMMGSVANLKSDALMTLRTKQVMNIAGRGAVVAGIGAVIAQLIDPNLANMLKCIIIGGVWGGGTLVGTRLVLHPAYQRITKRASDLSTRQTAARQNLPSKQL